MNPIPWLLGAAFALTLGVALIFTQNAKYTPAIWWGFACWVVVGLGTVYGTLQWVKEQNPVPTATQIDPRAWIVVKHVTTPVVRVGTPFQIVVGFINSGKVPARNVSAAYVVEPLPAGAEPTFAYARITRTGNAVIGAGGEFEGKLNLTKMPDGSLGALVEKELTAMRTGKMVVFVHGRVDYDDGHWTDFCYKLSIVQEPRSPSGLDAQWNAYKTHNDTDK